MAEGLLDEPVVFPATHLFLLSQIHPLENLAILGSLFPDTCITAVIPWQESHCCGFSLRDFMSPKERRELRPFLVGLLAHGIVPPGLDYYGDNSWGREEMGYAFLKAAPLVDEVIRVCRIPPEWGLWKAHNFVEMGIEAFIIDRRPDLPDCISRALLDGQALSALSEVLGRFWGKSGEDIVLAYKVLHTLTWCGSGGPKDLATMYAKQLLYRHGIYGVEEEQVARLIINAGELVRNEYESFLSSAANEIYAAMPVWLGEE